MDDAVRGKAPGVLEVVAKLPAISAEHEMDGAPEIRGAVLNGVNDTLRDEYVEHCKVHGLAGLHIPRQVIAHVEGDAPNFTLDLDESDKHPPLTHAQSEWLRRRAVVGNPANASKSDSEREQTGLSLLLKDLVPDEIQGKLI